MACKYVCDGCGKEASADTNHQHYTKPAQWYQRGVGKEMQDACSRECIDTIAKKTGVTNVVLPF